MDAWERRWAHRPAGARPPRPLLMHSNLESFEEIVQLSRHAVHAARVLSTPFMLPLAQRSCGSAWCVACGRNCLQTLPPPAVRAGRLPERIRPAIFAFGTLADGFLPFDLQLAQQAQQGDGGGEQTQQAHAECGGAVNGDSGTEGSAQRAQHGGRQCEIRLCSVVMKAVQVRAGRRIL